MKPKITMRDALTDPALLGSVLAGESWSSWRTLLIASMGEALDDAEREAFARMTGRAREPLERIEELWGIVGIDRPRPAMPKARPPKPVKVERAPAPPPPAQQITQVNIETVNVFPRENYYAPTLPTAPQLTGLAAPPPQFEVALGG